jgi:hypothetical protein
MTLATPARAGSVDDDTRGRRSWGARLRSMVAAWCGLLCGSSLPACATSSPGATLQGHTASTVSTSQTWTANGLPSVRFACARCARDDVTVLRSAFPRAAARIVAAGLRWRLPLRIVVHDDVDGFVKATGQTTPTLRAWTTWDTVHLLPRDTWRSADVDATASRLAHELCHAALLQRADDVAAARARPVPRFVAEGLCSVAAQQEHARLSLAALRAAIADGARVDFEGAPAFSYAYAHHVFAAVVACRGPAALVAAWDAAVAGARVEELLGAPPRRWLDDDACASVTPGFTLPAQPAPMLGTP